MTKKSKKLILISLILIAAGIILLGAGYALGGKPGVAITTDGVVSTADEAEPYVLKKTKLDSFSSADIKINTLAGNITLCPSADENFYIEYKLDGFYKKPVYEIKNNKLTFRQDIKTTFINWGFHLANVTDRPWWEMSSDELDAASEAIYDGTHITLYIPAGQILDTVNIYSDMGDINIEGQQMEDAKFNASYGNINIKDFTCDNAGVIIETGDIYLEAASIKNLTCKSEFGNVTMLLAQDFNEISFDLSTEFGDIRIPDEYGQATQVDFAECIYKATGSSDKKVNISAETGDIDIQEK